MCCATFRLVLRRLIVVVALLSLAALSPPEWTEARADEGLCSAGAVGVPAFALNEALDRFPPAPSSALLCSDECGPQASGRGWRRQAAQPGAWAGDGVCDDGGPGAANSECALGTDCQDCGVRGCDEENPCAEGQRCSANGCVFDLGEVPECEADALPPLEVTEGNPWEVAQFTPDRGDGYWDYAENGETDDDQYRSFLRRDVQQMIKYAAGWTRCLAQDWTFGNQQPLGLGDMSEEDGSIPGSREGDPDHPGGSHLYGQDIDIAYFQLDADENLLRVVCEHTDSKGRDQYHCVSKPDNLDVYRSALFLAKLHDHDNVRVIGVDGQVGPLIEEAWEQLCDEGWLDPDSRICEGSDKLSYETTNSGRGWFYHHHHHFHLSTYGGKGSFPLSDASEECLVPGCPELE